VIDTWTALGAIAARTERIAIGPMVTPATRRPPWVLALEATTLQRFSRGRLVLGVARGAPRDFMHFGQEPPSAAAVEEAIAHVRRSLDGPLWVGGDWPRRKPFLGAAHADGVFPVKRAGRDFVTLTRDDVRAVLAFVGRPVELAVWSLGGTDPDLEALEDAGATWWLVDALELGPDGVRRTIG
jgi:hypothetical protein